LSSIRISVGDEIRIWPVRIQPRAEKLPESGWLQMLTEVEAWMPGSSVGISGAKHGGVGQQGAAAPYVAEALVPLVPLFEKALRAMFASPRQQTQSRLEDVPARSARRANRETTRWMSSHPDFAQWLDPSKREHASGAEPHIPQRFGYETIDHPANRYISWLTLRVEKQLRETAAELRRLSQSKENEDAPWCASRSEEVEAAADRLAKLWRRSKLRDVQPEPTSEAALLVVLGDPIYTRIHRIGRRFISPMFRYSPDIQEYPAAVRPSFHMYEIWCFLAIARQFQALLPDWKWSHHGLQKLMSLSGSGVGAKYEATCTTGCLRLEFNPTFSGFLTRKNSARWTLSTERRPDIVVSWLPSKGEPAWVCLDSKYRAGRKNLGQAFESIHIYRDALRDNNAGGACRAVYLLAPKRTSKTAEWFSEEFRREHKAGICELRPGDNQSAAVAQEVAGILGLAN
jgi:hypothetical protein